jgi:hypothetical protein
MKILVNGSSISRGPGSWPYHLQKHLNCNLTNLALAGAGHTYIHETTVTELATRKYDLVLIMWPESGRIDFRVDDIEKFADSKNTSFFQSSVNIWPEKFELDAEQGYNDQYYVQKNWIFSLGYLQGQQDSVATIFKPCHQITRHEQIVERELIQIISLQSLLKSINQPYLFMHWQPIKRFERFEKYYSMLDWNLIYTDTCLEDIAKNNNWWDDDGNHPNASAHQVFSELIATKLNF